MGVATTTGADGARGEVPELLAPAGDAECLRAAVENGADAVYFGLDVGWNARVRAANFRLAELPETMAYLRRRGVRGYVTLNTLMFSEELSAAEDTVRQLDAAGVDAVLVQDLGLARLVREVAPGLSLHASTQMTLTCAEGIHVAEALGVERVVLPRELSLEQIRQIRSQTRMSLEAFVHGALCVAYSGQCLTSESLGGRSANRGQCAQACRLPYDLVCDGRDVDLGAVKYLLSPQDLAAYHLVGELLAAGVSSLKIEGRLKTPEYVANITQHYRRALDEAIAGRRATWTAEQIREMELSFSRGFSPGWLLGDDHKQLVPGLSSAKRGVLAGEVIAVRRGRVEIGARIPLAAGDGIVFEGDREHGEEVGGSIYGIEPVPGHRVSESGSQRCWISLARGVDLARLSPGQRIWKTADPQLDSRLRRTFSGPDPLRRVPLRLRVRAAVGQPLHIAGEAASGAHCAVDSPLPLAAAAKHPATVNMLREQLGRLGGTVYELTELEAEVTGGPLIPFSVLGALRRELVAQLDNSLAPPPRRVAGEPGALVRLRAAVQAAATSTREIPPTPELAVLCRSLDQLAAVLAADCREVLVDFADIRQYRDAVLESRAAGASLWLATPRVMKPGESGVLQALSKHQPAGLLVRHLAGVAFCRQHGLPFRADFSLNVTNELTAGFLRELGAERITASFDLNRDQLFELAAHVPPHWLEVVVHQHMPMFHMEHCVFCAVLSPGTDHTNCGRPCDRHVVHLRDRIGMEHLLTADVGCRNTLFNAVPQSGAEAVPGLVQRGLRYFRLDLLAEPVSEIGPMINLYRDLLAGHVTGRQVWERLRAANRVGVTRGTLEERRHPLAIL